MTNDLATMFGTHHGLDDKSVKFLAAALEKNNLPGFDYIEFKKSLAALTKMNMDEATSFKSAFATASTVGLTKEKLLKTADHYKSILIKENNQFNEALKKQIQKKVASKTQEIETMKKQVEEFKLKIQELQQKITSMESTIQNADGVVKETVDKLETSKNNFEHTYQSILNQIDKDIENINTYL